MTTTNDGEVGRRIRASRKSAGLTLRELSEDLDWSISRLSNYEQGIRTLKGADATRLAKRLKVAPSWLLCLDDDAITDAERELLDAIRDADPAVRESIGRLLDALKRQS